MCVGVRVREAVAVLEALELRDGAHVRVRVRAEVGVGDPLPGAVLVKVAVAVFD